MCCAAPRKTFCAETTAKKKFACATTNHGEKNVCTAAPAPRCINPSLALQQIETHAAAQSPSWVSGSAINANQMLGSFPASMWGDAQWPQWVWLAGEGTQGNLPALPCAWPPPLDEPGSIIHPPGQPMTSQQGPLFPRPNMSATDSVLSKSVATTLVVSGLLAATYVLTHLGCPSVCRGHQSPHHQRNEVGLPVCSTQIHSFTFFYTEVQSKYR